MTDHLPECRYVVFQQQGQIPEAVIPMGCICDALRACERRVREDDKNTFLRAAYDTGHEDGVQAARDAVAGLLHWSEGDLGLICNWNSACAAIDALRGEA